MVGWVLIKLFLNSRALSLFFVSTSKGAERKKIEERKKKNVSGLNQSLTPYNLPLVHHPPPHYAKSDTELRADSTHSNELYRMPRLGTSFTAALHNKSNQKAPLLTHE